MDTKYNAEINRVNKWMTKNTTTDYCKTTWSYQMSIENYYMHFL